MIAYTTKSDDPEILSYVYEDIIKEKNAEHVYRHMAICGKPCGYEQFCESCPHTSLSKYTILKRIHEGYQWRDYRTFRYEEY